MTNNDSFMKKIEEFINQCDAFEDTLFNISTLNLNMDGGQPSYISVDSTEWVVFCNRVTSFFDRYAENAEMIDFRNEFDAATFPHGLGIVNKNISDLKILFNRMIDFYDQWGDTADKVGKDDNDDTVGDKNKVEHSVKEKKILISHNSADKEYCEALVNLLERIGLTEKEVICTSVTGYGIRLNNDIYGWLASQFENDLHVIFMLSNNYYSSAPSLNEMGAAWVTQKAYTSIILPGFDINQIKGAVNPRKMALVLEASDDEIRQRLTEMRDILTAEFSIDKPSEIRWNRAVSDFIATVKELAAKIRDPITQDSQSTSNGDSTVNFNKTGLLPENISLSPYALVLVAYASKDPQAEIIVIRDLGGTHLNCGKWDFIGGGGIRVEALWMDALDELIHSRLVKLVGRRDRIYQVTSQGFAVGDAVISENEIDVNESPETYLADYGSYFDSEAED